MKKNEIKILGFIGLVFFVFLVILYFISSNINNEIVKYDGEVIIDSNRLLKYKSNEWENLENFDKIANNEFSIYSVDGYIGDYFVKETNNKYYFFDEEFKSYDINYSFIGISSSSKLSIINYSKVDLEEEDNSIIYKYLKSIDIKYAGDYSIKEKYKVDLNNNDKADYIFVLSNQLYVDDFFYIIFAKVDNKLIEINNQFNVDNIINYHIGWVLNSNNNGYNDLILSSTINESYNYYLYSYNGDGYNELLS